MSETYNLYATQNNKGVMRLREKRYLDAANCFCQAVQHVNDRQSRISDLRDCSDSDNGQSNHSYQDRNRNRNRNRNHPARDPRSSSQSPLSSNATESVSFREEISSGVESERNTITPPSGNTIESFYLLLDEDRYRKDNDVDSNFDAHDSSSLRNTCNHDCQQPCNHQSSANQVREEADVSHGHSADCDETFVFKNPILVSQGIHVRPEQNPMVDRATRAKLSLISVYNMALTYHLAALDNDSSGNRQIHLNSNGELLEQRTKKRKIVHGTRSTKRRKLSDSRGLKTTTNHAPVGDYKSKEPSFDENLGGGVSPKNPINAAATSTNHPTKNSIPNQNTKHKVASVDRVLLGQALAYYQIAYRILVSEQRVLVSQAMVILNNIGHIHRLLGKEENAKKCFQRLLTTMVYLQQAGNHAQIIQWDSFLNNVMDIIISPEASHKRFAPAA